MELSVVRIHKASPTNSQPWLQGRSIVHPEKYLSQCPFILLREESQPPMNEFQIRSRGGVLTMTLVLDGKVTLSDGTGARWELDQGDADFSAGRGGVLRGATAADSGARFLHLWVDLPVDLQPRETQRHVVRHADAQRVRVDSASALMYAGGLGQDCTSGSSPWPIAVADLSLKANQVASLPIASNERCFAYVLSGELVLGRNQVHLNRGAVGWIERTVEPGDLNSLRILAARDTRVLLLSSPSLSQSSSRRAEITDDCGDDALTAVDAH